MIYQRPSSNHTRDRDIANMPLEPAHAEGEHWAVSLGLWLAIITAVGAVYIAFHS